MLPRCEAVRAFHAASATALIDYVAFDLREGETPPSGITGRLKRHEDSAGCPGRGFTVHDPSPADLLALAGYKLIRVEVAIDLRPYRGVTGLERVRQLVLIHRFIASRCWPFDGRGIFPAYRVAKERGAAYKPLALNAEGDEVTWRLPTIQETLYLGDRYDYNRPGTNVRTWAQVKLYVKTTDQGQYLPEDQCRVRIEVTIAEIGLRALKITSAADLIGFNYRKLSEYFRLLKPAPFTLLPHFNMRRIVRKQRRASPLVLNIKRLAAEILSELALDEAQQAGMISLIHNKRVMPNAKCRDARANHKMGTALDNLSKKLSPI